MRTLSKEAYKDKVRGCWLGKNIGGTLGAPFEAHREALDLDFYTEDLSNGVLPNDDLDLQLAWLNAAEEHGVKVDAKVLAEYWLSAINPNWAEYGVGKSNLKTGFLPPLSGGYQNDFRNSNGAWIRSELWACLMPGHPEKAVRYAYQDAIVDHADEGVYAEVFTAALESAAFIESDYKRIIDIALSYIPEDCKVAKAVKLAKECYESGISWKEARIKLLNEIPGSFGGQLRLPNPDNIPQAEWGYDAPSNIGLTIIAWYYGEGDFSKSICIAAGCGEDADCTAATLGAVMGIILGASKIPSKWLEPIGDEIRTLCITKTCDRVKIPTTVTELTSRVCALMPSFMVGSFDMFDSGAEIKMADEENLYDHPVREWTIKPYNFKDEYPASFYTFTGETPNIKVDVTVEEDITVREGEIKTFNIHAENATGFVGDQLWLKFRWILPEGWSMDKGKITPYS